VGSNPDSHDPGESVTSLELVPGDGIREQSVPRNTPIPSPVWMSPARCGNTTRANEPTGFDCISIVRCGIVQVLSHGCDSANDAGEALVRCSPFA